VVADTLNPDFQTRFAVEHCSGAGDKYLLRVFAAGDEAGARLGDNDLVGSAVFSLDDALSRHGHNQDVILPVSSFYDPLLDQQLQQAGTYLILSITPDHGQERRHVKSSLTLSLQVVGLPTHRTEWRAVDVAVVLTRTNPHAYAGTTESVRANVPDITFKKPFTLQFEPALTNKFSISLYDTGAAQLSERSRMGCGTLTLGDLLALPLGQPLVCALDKPAGASVVVVCVKQVDEDGARRSLPGYGEEEGAHIVEEQEVDGSQMRRKQVESLAQLTKGLVAGRCFRRFFLDDRPRRITLCLQKDDETDKQRLYWCAEVWQEDAHSSSRVVKMDESRSMGLHEIKSILLGMQTQAFASKTAAHLHAECCFSLVSEDNILNLEAANGTHRDAWVFGLQILLQEQVATPPPVVPYGALPVTAPEYDMQERKEQRVHSSGRPLVYSKDSAKRVRLARRRVAEMTATGIIFNLAGGMESGSTPVRGTGTPITIPLSPSSSVRSSASSATKTTRVVNLTIACRNLPLLLGDTTGDATQLRYTVCLWGRDPATKQWRYVDKTDLKRDTASPDFNKVLRVPYRGAMQRVRLQVYNVRGKQVSDQDIVGSYNVRVKDLLNGAGGIAFDGTPATTQSPGRVLFTAPLTSSAPDKQAQLTAHGSTLLLSVERLREDRPRREQFFDDPLRSASKHRRSMESTTRRRMIGGEDFALYHADALPQVRTRRY
jgi:hypothetical protein